MDAALPVMRLVHSTIFRGHLEPIQPAHCKCGVVARRAPARAVYTAVMSDKCTFLRGKCKGPPVRLARAAAQGVTGRQSSEQSG